jgi:CheY-like chemotaxis protein
MGRLLINPRPTLVASLVEDTVESVRPAADAKDIAVTIAIDPAIGAITADPDRLQQILWNLVSNAVKFTPSGGRVEVRAERGPDRQSVHLIVRDTGVGLRPEHAAHLFERFRQGDSGTTRRYGGLGLGLGIVRHLVELHGGTVTGRSEGPNRGSTFEVMVPVQPAHQRDDARSSASDRSQLRGISVLVVDDNPFDLDLTRWSLERHGAVVTTATSAREARARYRGARPDVLVSDLKLPDRDGIQLIKEIREMDAATGRHTPAAALTKLGRVDDRRRALDAGYQMHVTKPVEPSALAAVVERLADDHRREQTT